MKKDIRGLSAYLHEISLILNFLETPKTSDEFDEYFIRNEHLLPNGVFHRFEGDDLILGIFNNLYLELLIELVRRGVVKKELKNNKIKYIKI